MKIQEKHKTDRARQEGEEDEDKATIICIILMIFMMCGRLVSFIRSSVKTINEATLHRKRVFYLLS